MAEILRVLNVTRRFGGLLALDRASFTADDGQIVALVGPNGAGKTTLFAIITGFLRAHEGRIRYQGDDITGEPPYLLARLRRDRCEPTAMFSRTVRPANGCTIWKVRATPRRASRCGGSPAISAPS